jgi:hypothetical protein
MTLGKTCVHVVRLWTWDKVFVTSAVNTTILDLLLATSAVPPTMVESSSFDDLF